MKITCIGHSGFLIELPEYNFIFDYFTDKKSVIEPEIFKDKSTCVFVSHSHYDHYNTRIFDWSVWGNILYILDNGCKIPDKSKHEKIIKACEGENFTILDGAIDVKIYGSTDEGVSFLVTAGSSAIFHAGDLNDWYWEDESTPEELIADEESYLRIIRKLAGQRVDTAFIPEDPRLKHNAGRAILHFKKIVAPERIIPMHFPGNDGLIY